MSAIDISTLPSAPAPTSTSTATPSATSTSFTTPIALPSPTDLAHLRATLLRTARQKIDLHLPPAANTATATPGGNGGALRADVERRVDAWIANLFAGVGGNVSVNGIPGSEALAASTIHDPARAGEEEAEYEAYDAPLAQRLTALHAQIESLHAHLATQRRDLAGAAASDYASGFSTWSDELGARETEAGNAMLARAAESDAQRAGLSVPFGGREERVRGAFEGAVGSMRGIEGGLRSAGERAAEAERVAEYLGGA